MPVSLTSDRQNKTACVRFRRSNLDVHLFVLRRRTAAGRTEIKASRDDDVDVDEEEEETYYFDILSFIFLCLEYRMLTLVCKQHFNENKQRARLACRQRIVYLSFNRAAAAAATSSSVLLWNRNRAVGTHTCASRVQ